MITIPNIVQKAIDMLEEKGYEAYVVGGCVRDIIIGRIPYDFDITTNAMPYVIEDVFSSYKTLDIGKKHGTITVFMNKDMPIEITTYRIDGDYNDSRHPNEVHFTSNLKDDLSRRDFTINAIAYNSKRGIVDLFSGIEDINIHTIRTIGNGEKRFTEDALRIIRAFRFSAQLGFTIDDETCNDILKTANLLSNISKERIQSEFSKILTSSNAEQTLVLMESLNVLKEIIPALYVKKTDLSTAFSAMGKSENILAVRLALLFCDIDNGERIASDSLKLLRYDNATIKTVIQLIQYCNIEIKQQPINVKQWLNKLSLDVFLLLLTLKKARRLANEECVEIIDNLHKIVMRIINENECYCKKDLKINGDDLINLGYKEGKGIAEILDSLLELVIEDNSLNTREKLIEIVEDN